MQTPTGNPPNPFFFGPVVLLHVFFPPSIVLLRSVALLSGLAALAVNWLLCRWVFDRRTAVISTLGLAVLPINIAYSRFAWDASQSVLATLPILYFSLAAVRFPQRRDRMVTAAVLAQIAAVLVHPTNIFAGAAIAAAVATWLRWHQLKRIVADRMGNRRVTSGIIVVGVILLVLAVCRTGTGSPRLLRFAERMGGVGELIGPQTAPHYAVLFPRLFTGGTVYRDIAGSRCWWEWPSADGVEGWGIDPVPIDPVPIDGVLFWGAVAVAIGLLWRSWKTEGRMEDRVLISAWALGLLAFLLVAGPRAMIPGWQRYAMCLVGPTVVLVARGLALCLGGSPRRCRLVLMAVSLAAWLVLADYHAHYFHFIRQTGGRGHRTFRTAAVEPKQAALQHILQHRNAHRTPSTSGRRTSSPAEPPATWIVASEWWNRLPLQYLAMAEEGIRVVEPEETEDSAEFDIALGHGRVWCVEFSGSEGADKARSILEGREVRRRDFADYSGRPLLSLLHGQ